MSRAGHAPSLPEIIWFADVPVLERDRPAVRHPEERSLLGLVGAGGPKVLVAETKVLDVLLEPVVLLLRGYTCQMHPVITAILRGPVPVRLRSEANFYNDNNNRSEKNDDSLRSARSPECLKISDLAGKYKTDKCIRVKMYALVLFFFFFFFFVAQGRDS